jgi:hypothetical protein
MDYEIVMRVRKPGVRINALARKREPEELFVEVCDALKDNGWEIVGVVSVRPLEKYL